MTKIKAAPHKQLLGRPRASERKVTMSIRFNAELIAQLDAWAATHGDIGRSAAIRQAVAKMVREEKVT